jgi:hypothetical protein
MLTKVVSRHARSPHENSPIGAVDFNFQVETTNLGVSEKLKTKDFFNMDQKAIDDFLLA